MAADRSPAGGFDRAAPTYDRAATVQTRLARVLADRIAADAVRTGPPPRILELGCGTGELTRHLAGRFPAARILATDPSAAMLRAAQAKLAGRRVEFRALAAEQTGRLRRRFDLVASSAALQWCPDLPAALAGIARVLAPGGRFAALLFGPETYRELRDAVAAEFGAGQAIAAAGFPDRDRLKAELPRHFRTATVAETRLTEEYASLREFLRVIRATGTRGRGLAGHGLLTPRRLARLEAHCRGRCSALSVSYQAFIVTAA